MNIGNVAWTAEIVEEWLCVAAQVERALPPVGPRMAKPRLIIVRDWTEMFWDELHDKEDKPEPRFQPTNGQVSQWEEVVLRWLPLVDSAKDTKILWWRACGMSWSRIGKRLELERHTIANRHKRALEDLAKLLNREKS